MKTNRLSTSARPLKVEELTAAEAAKVNGGSHHKKHHHPVLGVPILPHPHPVMGVPINPNP
jgi:hypothetical protein